MTSLCSESQDSQQNSGLEGIHCFPKLPWSIGLNPQSISVVPEAAAPQWLHLCQEHTEVRQGTWEERGQSLPKAGSCPIPGCGGKRCSGPCVYHTRVQSLVPMHIPSGEILIPAALCSCLSVNWHKDLPSALSQVNNPPCRGRRCGSRAGRSPPARPCQEAQGTWPGHLQLENFMWRQNRP